MYIQSRNRLTDTENKHGYQTGEGRREGQMRGVGLTDTNYYI